MRYSCLLRAINVSGQRKIKMTELCDLCLSLGFKNVEYYLQSGNIILNSDLSATDVEKKLSEAICATFGYDDVDVMTLNLKDLEEILKKNPYQGGDYDRSKVYFTFLKNPPDPTLSGIMDRQEFAPDVFSISPKVIYVYCPNGYGKTKINNSFFERKLKVRATTRNLNTTEKLRELTAE